MDKIKDVAVRLGIITVQDMERYTALELIMKVANKVNELVNEVWRFETDVQESLRTQNENIQYLLGEGLHLEVGNIFDGWVQDGTFDTLINQSALKKVNERIDEVQAQTNEQLSQIDNKKISQHEPNSISIEMLNTQVKNLLTTGDKVAIVGGNSVSMAQFATSIQEDIGEYLEKAIKEETGFYTGNVGSKLNLEDNSTFQHHKVPVSEGEKYLITCGVGEQEGFACVWFVDSAEGLISKS